MAASIGLSACGTLPQAPAFSTQAEECEEPPLLFSGTFTTSYWSSAMIAPPIAADGSSVFELGSTIPVKIRVLDCNDERVNALSPTFVMELLDEGGGVADLVEVIRSSSAMDVGNTLRQAGAGQYLFNLSTLLSGLDGEGDLPPGWYRLTISSGDDFSPVLAEFTLK